MGLVNKIKNIANGWSSLLLGLNSELARERALHCKECTEAVRGTYEEFINDEIVEVQGLKCAQCTCPLSAKLRSKNDNCPLGKW